MIRNALPAILLLLPLAACQSGEHGEETPPPPATASSVPQPLSSRSTPSGPSSSAPAEAGTIRFAMPAGWQQQPPANQMRLAQAVIPAAPGASGPGDLVVFYFGPGGGGGVEANIERWIAQVEPDAGSDPQPETFEANGLRVTWIEISGTLKPSTMGMGPATEQPGSRLYGAVVEGPGGPWFFKATGPAATLAAERDGFLEMLRSARAGQL